MTQIWFLFDIETEHKDFERMQQEPVELWKSIVFEDDYVPHSRYEISNRGRVRSFNKNIKGRILKGSITEGYPVLRLRLYRQRSTESKEKIIQYQNEIKHLKETRKEMIASKEHLLEINRISELITDKEKKLSLYFKADEKKRTIYKQLLIHRLVVTYFLPPPQSNEKIVAHLDYEKKNNRVENLKWMAPEEHAKHIRKSPYVIAEKKQRFFTQKHRKGGGYYKLTSTEVMRIKKLLKRGRKQARIAREFGVSEMQISRIKSGENWGHIKI